MMSQKNTVIARELSFKCLFFNEKYKYGDLNISDEYLKDILDDYFEIKLHLSEDSFKNLSLELYSLYTYFQLSL